jgi:hypothetical protein
MKAAGGDGEPLPANMGSFSRSLKPKGLRMCAETSSVRQAARAIWNAVLAA